MPSEPKRKLTAIMFIDMVGYTAMMQKDEQNTQRLVKEQRDIVKQRVTKFKGTVLSYTGDGTLITFGSAIEAVNCGIDIQKSLSDNEEINLRIGIHVGDVVIEEDDIFGDGVNVASRIEPLAAPGGICISDRVFDDIKNQKGITGVSLGPRKLKNVERPLEVYALTGEGLSSPGIKRKYLQRSTLRRGLWSVGTVFILTILYIFLVTKGEPLYGDVASVGVLYLNNLGTEDDDFLSYGITEDLIIDLSRAGLIRVLPMKDILPYKDSDLTLAEITRKLKVRFVLTGSIHREENNFRLAAQLIEPLSNRTIWSNRWEEPQDNISAIKGKMIHEVIDALGISINPKTAQEIEQKPTTDPAAYEFYLRGKYNYAHMKNTGDLAISRGLLEKSIELDPNFIAPRIALGKSYAEEANFDTALNIYFDALHKAEDTGSFIEKSSVLSSIGFMYFKRTWVDSAFYYYNKSLELSRKAGDRFGEQQSLNDIGFIYTVGAHLRDLDKAIDVLTQSLVLAREINDIEGEINVLSTIGFTYLQKDERDKALESYTQELALSEEIESYELQLTSLIDLGNWSNFREAMKYFERARLLAKTEENSKDEAYMLNIIALRYYSLLNYLKAIDFGKQSLEILLKINDYYSQQNVFTVLGNSYYELGEYTNALDSFTKALASSEKLEQNYTKGEAHYNLGRAYFSMGQYLTAMDHLEKAITIFKNTEVYESDIPKVLSYQALCEFYVDNNDAALELTNQLVPLLEDLDGDDIPIIVLWNVSRIYIQLGQNSKSLIYLEQTYQGILNQAESLEDMEERNTYLSTVILAKQVKSAWEGIDRK